MKIPTTIAELNAAANLTYQEGSALISKADKALVEQWGRSLYGDRFGHPYLHASDHKAALRVLLGREPTFIEVQNSSMAGARNIDAARVKESGGERPSEWDTMSADSRRYAVLVHRYKISRGSKIFDGAKDPDPTGTAALLAEWSGGSVPDPEEPPRTEPKPEPKPELPPVAPLDLAAELRAMEARINVRLDQILARLPR